MTSIQRNLFVLTLITAVVAGCSGTSSPTTSATALSMPPPAATRSPDKTASSMPSVPPNPSPSVAQTSTASAPPTSTPIAWPSGIKAYPADSAGNELGYLEYLPPDYDKDSHPPLLVFLHDTPEGGDGSEADLYQVLNAGIPRMLAAGGWSAEQPFVVLMPQMPEAIANAHCDFGATLDKFLGYAVSTYGVDPKRLYLTGISCGGIAVWDYVSNTRLNKVAAIVPIASAPFPYVANATCLIAQMPNWTFHGALDDVIPVHYIEDAEEILRDCPDQAPTDLKVTIYPDAGHNDSWDRVYDGSAGDDIYAWMLSHELSATDAS